MRSRGDLPTVYRALVDAPEAWQQPLAKYKTPNDYIVSTFRALALPVQGRQRGLACVRAARPAHVQPGLACRLAGSQRGLGWRVGADEAHRMGGCGGPARRHAQQRCAARAATARCHADARDTRTAIARAASGAQALTLLLTAPEFLRR